MKKKTILMGTYTLAIYLICILGMLSSCASTSEEGVKAQEVQTDTGIILETLHDGMISTGIYKATIDSTEYIIVKTGNSGQGVAIIKHN